LGTELLICRPVVEAEFGLTQLLPTEADTWNQYVRPLVRLALVQVVAVTPDAATLKPLEADVVDWKTV
jgi:hypothetical protein